MNQPHNPSSITSRLESLSRGWAAGPGGGSHVFVSALAKHLGCRAALQDATRDVFSFTLDLSRIRLKGMDDIPCLLVGGMRPETVDCVQSFVRSRVAPGRAFFVLIANDEMFDLVTAATSGQRCVLIGRGRLQSLLEASDPITFLTTEIRRTLPRRSLIPYDILRSASGGMFYGRTKEFNRLCEEDSTCFAITGPGRAGKTSLVKSYLRALKEARTARSTATFYIDLMECTQKNADGYARLIATRIDSSRRSERVTADEFLGLLRSLVVQFGQTINLILDETDDLCLDDQASRMLALAARHELLRLVLCGRGDLFRNMLDPASHFADRLELLKVGPLEEHAARKLLVEPLADLGIVFSSGNVVEELMRLSGQFPHLIQLYAKRLAEYSIENRVGSLNMETLDVLRWDYELAQYFMSPMQDLRDPVSKLVALTLLNDHQDIWTPIEIMQRVDGLEIDRTNDLCNELVISNILTWHGGSFRLANQALRLYAKQLGYLDGALQEARHSFATRKGGAER